MWRSLQSEACSRDRAGSMSRLQSGFAMCGRTSCSRACARRLTRAPPSWLAGRTVPAGEHEEAQNLLDQARRRGYRGAPVRLVE